MKSVPSNYGNDFGEFSTEVSVNVIPDNHDESYIVRDDENSGYALEVHPRNPRQEEEEENNEDGVEAPMERLQTVVVDLKKDMQAVIKQTRMTFYIYYLFIVMMIATIAAFACGMYFLWGFEERFSIRNEKFQTDIRFNVVKILDDLQELEDCFALQHHQYLACEDDKEGDKSELISNAYPVLSLSNKRYSFGVSKQALEKFSYNAYFWVNITIHAICQILAEVMNKMIAFISYIAAIIVALTLLLGAALCEVVRVCSRCMISALE